jgi:hypothetical protein
MDRTTGWEDPWVNPEKYLSLLGIESWFSSQSLSPQSSHYTYWGKIADVLNLYREGKQEIISCYNTFTDQLGIQNTHLEKYKNMYNTKSWLLFHISSVIIALIFV